MRPSPSVDFESIVYLYFPKVNLEGKKWQEIQDKSMGIITMLRVVLDLISFRKKKRAYKSHT